MSASLTGAPASESTSPERTSTSIRYVGIDPGMSGAVAIIGHTICLHDTPVERIKPGSTKRQYLPVIMAGLLVRERELRSGLTVCIEKQQSMPGQGVSSTFSTGYGFGLWIGILAALGIPYTEVRPRTWKEVMFRDMAGDAMSAGNGKAAARLRAMQLFPSVSDQLARVKDHGRADALLIAEYHRRTVA